MPRGKPDMTPPAEGRPAAAQGWARWQGFFVPLAAVAAVGLVLLLLGALVALDHAVVPKPPFRELVLQGYPQATPLMDAALIVEALLWWLCLSFVLWLVGLAAVGLCWLQLHRATRHDPALARVAGRLFLLLALLAVAGLVYVAEVRQTPLMSFGLVVDNLALIANGLVQLSTFNTGLVYVVGSMLLLSVALLLVRGAHADTPLRQMRAITDIMFGGAVFALVWIATATGMYRLAAMMLVPQARDPLLKLAPTISLMGGLFLSLLLAVAYLSAGAWLQHCHDKALTLTDAPLPAAEAASPRAFLAAHWPKVVAILLPLLPGVAEKALAIVANLP